jgi:hypothetical protein
MRVPGLPPIAKPSVVDQFIEAERLAGKWSGHPRQPLAKDFLTTFRI